MPLPATDTSHSRLFQETVRNSRAGFVVNPGRYLGVYFVYAVQLSWSLGEESALDVRRITKQGLGGLFSFFGAVHACR